MDGKDSNEVSVTLPSDATCIEECAFQGCAGLRVANIPVGVRRICKKAFKNCVNLEELIFLGNVCRIGKEAFANCTSLRSVVLPPSLKTIEERTFFNCRSLTEVVLPPTLRTIKSFAFFDCSKHLNLQIPPTVNSVEGRRFHGGYSLGKNVTFLGSLRRLLRGKVEGLLHGVEVVYLSDVEDVLSQVPTLAKHVEQREASLHPEIEFVILHSMSSGTRQAVSQHAPANLLCVRLTLSELLASGHDALALTGKASLKFRSTILAYAEVAVKGNMNEDVLYVVATFLAGETEGIRVKNFVDKVFQVESKRRRIITRLKCLKCKNVE